MVVQFEIETRVSFALMAWKNRRSLLLDPILGSPHAGSATWDARAGIEERHYYRSSNTNAPLPIIYCWGRSTVETAQ
jgi:hypothetical protein